MIVDVDGSLMRASLDSTMMSIGRQTQLPHLLGGSSLRFTCPHNIVQSPDRVNELLTHDRATAWTNQATAPGQHGSSVHGL